MKTGFDAVSKLVNEDKYEWKDIYRLYNKALVEGKKDEEITEKYLLDQLHKQEELKQQQVIVENKPNYFTNDGKKTKITAAEFAAGPPYYHSEYGVIIQVGAVPIGSYITWAITEDGKMLDIDVRDLTKVIDSKNQKRH